jgi:hypothetical protein
VYIDNQSGDVTKYYDEDLGGAPTTNVRWSSTNATRCSDVLYRSAETGNVWTTVVVADDADYSNRRGTSGSVTFDGDPRLVTETTEFAVGCYNDNEDPATERWDTNVVTVNSIPTEPSPIAISLWSPNYPQATADALSGYATATVYWNVSYADECEEKAYRMDGTEITVPGWSFYPWEFSGSRLTSLSTTTKFTLSCSRGARTYNDTTYLATSSYKELIIEVQSPSGGSMDEWDRSDPTNVPPVTVTGTATPNPTYLDALTGNAITAISIQARNASYCYLDAYSDSDGDGNYTNPYYLPGWTRTGYYDRLNGNYIGTISINLRVSSRLRIDCIREYDLLYGTAAEQENGREEFSITVEVISFDEPAPDPEVYLYSNAVRETANDIWAKRTAVSGFVGVAGSSPKSYLYGALGAGLTNSISFPFMHPYGEANAYDIWLQYCDNVVPDGRIGIAITADDVDYVYFNGTYLGNSSAWTELKYYTPTLRPGLNVIAAKVVDTGGYAGFLAAMKWAGGSIVSDASWKVSTTLADGWNSLTFDDSGWVSATTHGVYGTGPWGAGVSGFLGGTGAQWIWTPNYYNGDRELYVRYSFYVDPEDLIGDGTTRVHKVYNNAGAVVGTHNLSGVIAPVSCAVAPHNRVRIASSVMIQHEDTITLECTNGSAEDQCPVNRLYFGAGNNSNVVARMDPVTELAKVQMLWLSENTTSCSALYSYNPITGVYLGYVDGTGYTDRFPSLINVSTSTRYAISCSRASDGKSAQSTMIVNVPFRSIYSITTLVFSGQCIDKNTATLMDAPPGYGPDSDGFCVPLLDLSGVNPSASLASAVEDNVNGTYDLPVLMAIKNVLYNGNGAPLPENSAISYKATMALMPAHGLSPLETSTAYFNGSLEAPTADDAPVQSGTLTRSFTDVPFGIHELCARINLDGSPNYAEANPDVSNNTVCTTINLPVPPPPMTIDADRKLIRPNQSAEIEWSVNVTYQLQCQVRGAGGLNESFDTLLVGPAYSDSFTTGPLTSTAVYQIQCTEPITNTVFTDEVRVEMEPDVEEI